MKFGYWMPVFGGWLRNISDEGMEPCWDYVRRLAQRSEQTGWDLSLIAELNLNDIKGGRGAGARRLVHCRRTGRSDRKSRDDGRRASQFSPTRLVCQGRREHR